MKKIVRQFKAAVLFAGVLVGVLTAANVQAADSFGTVNKVGISQYAHTPLTTNTGPILVAGSFTTNIPANAAKILPIPKSGFGAFLRTGGTNASDTTNLVIVLEGIIYPTGSPSGGTQVVDNATLTISTPTTASTLPTGYDYLTNFMSATTASQSEAVLRHCDGFRVRSIQNTNLNSIWVSNLFGIYADDDRAK